MLIKKESYKFKITTKSHLSFKNQFGLVDPFGAEINDAFLFESQFGPLLASEAEMVFVDPLTGVIY